MIPKKSTDRTSIHVLVADDHPATVERIVSMLSRDAEIRVIGCAYLSEDLPWKTEMHKPDVILLGIGMALNGEGDLLRRVMMAHPSRILVLLAPEDDRCVMDLKSMGAMETAYHPDTGLTTPDALIDKIKFMAGVRLIYHSVRRPNRAEGGYPHEPCRSLDTKVAAVAASTGGPKALHVFLCSLPADFSVPIVIAQHIDKDFVPQMVDWLNQQSALNVKVAEEGDRIMAGGVYVSPAHCHMVVSKHRRIEFRPRQPSDIYLPSCDMLLESIADAFGSRSIGIVLTGMGSDGAKGMMRIKQAGGVTVAQDENTSLIYGMPKAAIDSGSIDQVLPLNDIATYLRRIVE